MKKGDLEIFYQELFENAGMAMFVFDEEGRILVVNKAFEKLSGMSRAKIEEGVHWTTFVVPEDLDKILTIHDQMTKQETGAQGYEFRWLTRLGETVGVRMIISPLGDAERFLAVVQDISREKRIESQWAESQKLEALGTLADGIAHEFNNILMGIQGYVSLLHFQKEDRYADDDKLYNIEQLVEKGANLTKQLLGFAQNGVYEIRPTNINQLINESSEIFGKTKREIRIHKKLQDDLWQVAADSDQLEQALMNLYINAWQAMPAGGDLSLVTRNRELTVNDHESFGVGPGRYVEIIVSDTGVGMDESTMQRIFEPFFTTKEIGQGTGLGLAYVYGIVKNHRGMIRILSEKGKGASFEIYLPAIVEKVALPEEKEEGMTGGMETILVVDDEEININVLEEWLDILGYKVLTASNGPEALDLYRTQADQIDLVLLDMIMPGMNGGEVFDAMKDINPHVRVILSSGYSIDGKAKEILQRGIKAFIQKPFRIDGLAQKIREVLSA